jgi:hypothetical protein
MQEYALVEEARGRLKAATKAAAEAAEAAEAGEGGDGGKGWIAELAAEVEVAHQEVEQAVQELGALKDDWSGRFRACIRDVLLCDLPAALAMPLQQAQQQVEALLAQRFLFLPMCEPGMLAGQQRPWQQALADVLTEQHEVRQELAHGRKARRQQQAAQQALQLATTTLARLHLDCCELVPGSGRGDPAHAASLAAVVDSLDNCRQELQQHGQAALQVLQQAVHEAAAREVDTLLGQTSKAAGLAAVINELVPSFDTTAPAFYAACSASGTKAQFLAALQQGAFSELHRLDCNSSAQHNFLRRGELLDPKGRRCKLHERLFAGLAAASRLELELPELRADLLLEELQQGEDGCSRVLQQGAAAG